MFDSYDEPKNSHGDKRETSQSEDVIINLNETPILNWTCFVCNDDNKARISNYLHREFIIHHCPKNSWSSPLDPLLIRDNCSDETQQNIKLITKKYTKNFPNFLSWRSKLQGNIIHQIPVKHNLNWPLPRLTLMRWWWLHTTSGWPSKSILGDDQLKLWFYPGTGLNNH